MDLTISAMTLHHLEPDAGVRYLAEMDRAARAGFVVNDLVRSRVAPGLVWLITRFITRGAISRHDGPLSVKRSYTPGEVSGLCEQAGLRTSTWCITGRTSVSARSAPSDDRAGP